MAKPVLINQSKPFIAEELRTLFDYHDHNYGSCVKRFQYWARTGNLCGHSHSAATEATIAETSLANSWGEGANSRGHSECAANRRRGGMSFDTSQSFNDLCRLLITCRLPSVYASFQPRTTKSLKSCTQWFSCFHYGARAAAAGGSSSGKWDCETVIPVHAIEDKGMNFQM